MDIHEISRQNQATAWQIIEDTQIVERWKAIGAEVNLVGSLNSGLMMTHRDIDFHIYTNELVIADSFWVMQGLAEHPRIKEIFYKNGIDTEEECIEWHAWYEDDDNNRWQLDLIHIRKGSRYDGVVEEVTEAICRVLTPETKQAILEIKSQIPEGAGIMGLDVYRAVFTGGVRNYRDFLQWHRQNPLTTNGLDWRPEKMKNEK